MSSHASSASASPPYQQQPLTPLASSTPPTATRQPILPLGARQQLLLRRAFKPVVDEGVYIEGRLSGLSTPASVYRYANLIIPDQLPSIPLRDVPRRFATTQEHLDTVRRTLWTAFATACETRTPQSPVSRRIAFALGEASLPRTPIDFSVEQWILSQENLLQQAHDEPSELECIMYQYTHARSFVDARGHFDHSIPLCGQAHVDALAERLEKVARERVRLENKQQLRERMEVEQKAARRAARMALWGLKDRRVRVNPPAAADVGPIEGSGSAKTTAQ